MKAYIDWKIVLVLCTVSGIAGWFLNDYYDERSAPARVSDSVRQLKEERIDHVFKKIQSLNLEKVDRHRKLDIIDSLILVLDIDTSANVKR